MKKVIARLLIGAIVVVAAASVAACQSEQNETKTEIKTGVLTGVEATGDFESVFSQQPGALKTVGRVIVTLDTGEEVRAEYPASMEADLRGGQTLEIEKVQVDGEDGWLVTRILSSP